MKWTSGALGGFAPIVNAPGGVNNYAPLDSGALTGTYTLNGVAIATGGPFASLASPIFVGTPTAPTAAPGSTTNQLATTAFVTNAITSLNLATTYAPLTNPTGGQRNYAPIASPNFTGVPIAVTAAPGTATQQLATTAFVTSAIGALSIVTSFNGRNGPVTLTASDITAIGGVIDASPSGGPYGRYHQAWLDLSTYFAPFVNPGSGQNNYAALASPVFSGTPNLPTGTVAVTQAPGTNNTTVATTAFVQAKFATGVTSWNGRTGGVTLTLGDVTGVGGAPIANPTFQGNVACSGTYFGGQFSGSNVYASGTVQGVNVNATSGLGGGTVYIDGNYGFAGSNYYLAIDGSNNRFLNWAANWYNFWRASDGMTIWGSPNGYIMYVDGSGNLTCAGNHNVAGTVTASVAVVTNAIQCNNNLNVGSIENCVGPCVIQGPCYPYGGINTGGAGITCGPVYSNSIVQAAGGACYMSGGNVVANAAVYAGGAGNSYYMVIDGSNNRLFNWFPGWYDLWQNGTGYRRFFNPSQEIAHLGPNGRWGAYGYDVISDVRGKHTINRDERGLVVIRQLQPKTFSRDWSPLDIEGAPVPKPEREFGFIAQDILPVLKEAVKEWLDPDKTTTKYAVDPMAILAALVNAVQELDKKVNQ